MTNEAIMALSGRELDLAVEELVMGSRRPKPITLLEAARRDDSGCSCWRVQEGGWEIQVDLGEHLRGVRPDRATEAYGKTMEWWPSSKYHDSDEPSAAMELLERMGKRRWSWAIKKDMAMGEFSVKLYKPDGSASCHARDYDMCHGICKACLMAMMHDKSQDSRIGG